MPAALLPILKLILSLGGGVAAERGISALLGRLAPSIASAAPKLAASAAGKALGSVGRFGAQTAAFGVGQHAVERLFGEPYRETDVSDVDMAMMTPYPGSNNTRMAQEHLARQADLREALMAMGVEGLV